jgi:hypothetical protein
MAFHAKARVDCRFRQCCFVVVMLDSGQTEPNGHKYMDWRKTITQDASEPKRDLSYMGNPVAFAPKVAINLRRANP